MPSFLIPQETSPGENRVAASPETVKKLVSLGLKVSLESDAGTRAGFSNESYISAGADIVSRGDQRAWEEADVIFCVQAPLDDHIKKLKPGSLIAGLLDPYGNKPLSECLQENRISAFALELLPRISRAQSADALSSQANIAGYKAVLLGASELDRYFPMLMTAAGTVQPAKVVVLGAGVAGLQAVATSRRLGAVVYVSDIRPAVKEQVESLGARFISPPENEEKPSESGGYAKQASERFLIEQREQLALHLSEADVAISTAQVPGKKAPLLINEEILDRMRPGSVVVDLAVDQGGNCSGTLPGKTTLRKGVKLIGASGLPSSVPNHASSLYSRNLLALFEPFIKDGELELDLEDELVSGCLISDKGTIRYPDIINQGGAN